MSSPSCVLSEEHFQCSICLDVFTDPVTIPCGHNFCKKCITRHWNCNSKCRCPLCSKVFDTRPELHVNTFISGMAAQVRQPAAINASSYSVQKISSSGEERICQNHDRPLEMFCKTDQRCVCISCAEFDHRTHHIVPLRNEYEQKKATLEEEEAKIQQKIQERQLKIGQIKQSLRLSKEEADHSTTASVQVLTPLIRSVEEGLAQLLESIEEKHKKTETQAEGFIKELEKEISELRRRSAKMEQLSCTEDHLQFLQNFSSLSPAPPTRDWREVGVHLSHEGTVGSAVAQLEGTLMKEIRGMCVDFDLKRVQQFAVDVTLDPDTASPYVALTNDKKKVYYGKKQSLPYNAERFSQTACVLGKESFSAGKSYFEVQVTGKYAFDLGVALGSIRRKCQIRPDSQSDLWVFVLRKGCKYRALSGSSVLLSLKSKPQKVGVFVDYEGGLVSFYDADTAALIYSFTGCNFTDKLFPIFGPCDNKSGYNSAPLIITPVNRRLRSQF